jgi:hypothetical protein
MLSSDFLVHPSHAALLVAALLPLPAPHVVLQHYRLPAPLVVLQHYRLPQPENIFIFLLVALLESFLEHRTK